MNMTMEQIALASEDGHRWTLDACIPGSRRAALLWLPALGVAARHYQAFAEALAARGIATFLHEWRGHGSSSLRASHACNWAYRELLERDIPTSQRAMAERLPGLPAILGGHSLGGQMSACRLALAPESASRLWLVGSGVPFAPAFSARLRWGLPLLFALTPWLAKRFGALPGRTIGFGGREAEGVMRDWAGTGRAERYLIHSMGRDLDPLMRDVRVPVEGVLLDDDWYAPEASMRGLAERVGGAVHLQRIDRTRTDGHHGHFGWMRAPAAVADALAASLDAHAPVQP